MLNFKSKKTQFITLIALLVLLLVVLALIIGNKPGIDYKNEDSAENSSKGFTFFGLGAESRLSKSIRDTLSDKLGADTVEKLGTLDLTINYKGFLKQHFPKLYDYQLQLNDPSGARIEHNILTITYRYPPKSKTSFSYVKLVFSNDTKKPLYFIINAEKNGSSLLPTLTKKYGKPELIKWNNESGDSVYWQQAENIMVFSQLTNRIGLRAYQIRIFYGDSISEMLLAEKELKESQSQAKAGETAF